MLIEFQGTWDGHLGRVDVSEHRADLLNDKIRPFHFDQFRAEPTARQFAAAAINRMIVENVMKLTTTEEAAPIEFTPKKDHLLCFCVNYRNLNGVTIRDLYPLLSWRNASTALETRQYSLQ